MQKELYPIFGILPVLNTPFTKDGKINITDLKRHVEMAIQAGVVGILVPAMASEVYKLSHRERQTMVATVLEQANGRIPIIGGAGEFEKEKRYKIIHDLLDLGCKNVLLQIPYENDEQFLNDFSEVAAFDIEMIMLQDWDATGYGLPVELIANLFETIESFRCLKIEVVPAGVKYSEILTLTQGRLHISGGWAVPQLLEGLERGVHAFIPTGMYDIYTTIYAMYQSDRKKEARTLFNALLPVLAFSNQHLDISIHFFKRLLYRQGIYSTPFCRSPILPFDAIHQKIADILIKRVLDLSYQVREYEF